MKYFLDQTGTEGVLKKIQDSFVRSGGVRLTNTATGTMRETASFENDISGPVAEIQSIKGNTIIWNQLAPYNIETQTKNGITITNNGDGSYTFSGTTSVRVDIEIKNVKSIAGHKYLMLGFTSEAENINGYSWAYEYRSYGMSNYEISTDYGQGGVFYEETENQNRYLYFVINSEKQELTLNDIKCYPQLFDLTLMFGAGNEPTTVEEFRAMFPLDYYDYDAGSLKNVHVDSIHTVGFNALNINGTEDMSEINYSQNEQRVFKENTFIVGMSRNNMISKDNVTSGEISNNTIKCAGQNAFGICFPIKILEQVEYQITGDIVTGSLGIGGFDINGNLLSHYNASTYGNITTSPASAAGALVAVVNDENGTCEISNLCFHLVHSGAKNGVYEPYAAYNKSINTDAILADGLKSVSTDVYDELTPTKLIRRVGSVDLGTLTGTKHTNNYSSETRYFGTANFSGNVRSNSTKMRCIRYRVSSQSNTAGVNGADKIIAVSDNTSVGIHITDSAFDDYTADQVKAALSGEYLYYDYLTPVETVFEEPLDGTYICEDFGTEEGIFPSDIPAPHPAFSSTIKYGSNFTDTLRRLSDIYVSHAELSDELKNFSRQLDTKLSGYARYIFINNTYPGGPTIEYVYNELKKRNVETAFIEFNGYFSGKCIVTMRSMGGIADTAIINLETGGFAQDYASYTKEFKAVYDQAGSLGGKTQHIILNTTSQTRVSVKPYNQLEVVLDISASSYGSDTPYMSLIFLNENAEAVGGVDCCFPLPSSGNPLVFKRLSSNMIQYRNTPTTGSVYTASIDIADIVLSFRSTSNDNFILYLSEYGR